MFYARLAPWMHSQAVTMGMATAAAVPEGGLMRRPVRARSGRTRSYFRLPCLHFLAWLHRGRRKPKCGLKERLITPCRRWRLRNLNPGTTGPSGRACFGARRRADRRGLNGISWAARRGFVDDERHQGLVDGAWLALALAAAHPGFGPGGAAVGAAVADARVRTACAGRGGAPHARGRRRRHQRARYADGRQGWPRI